MSDEAMTCANCGADMTKSTVGWLCLNCGATENTAKHKKVEVHDHHDPEPQHHSSEPIPEKAHTFQLPEHQPSSPPVNNNVKSRPKPAKRNLIIAAIITLLVVAAYLAPLALAWRRFEAKVPTIKTARLTGSLEFYGQDFLSAYDSKMNFDGAFDRNQSPLSLALNFDGTWAKQRYTGQSVIRDGLLNFRLASDHLPVIRVKQTAALVPLTDQWYKVAVDKRLFDNVCENRASASHPDLLGLYRLIKSTHLRPSPINNPLATVDGHRVTELNGTIDNHNFAAIVSAVTTLLPDGCDLSTMGLTATDVAKMQLSYTLWTSQSVDRLKLTLADKTLGSGLTIMINGSDYNQPQTIASPNQATDLNQLELAAIKSLAKN